MERYTFVEYRDMIICYSEARSNSSEAQRIYGRLGEDGCFKKPNYESGINKAHRAVANGEVILQIVENNSRISTRRISASVPNANS